MLKLGRIVHRIKRGLMVQTQSGSLYAREPLLFYAKKSNNSFPLLYITKRRKKSDTLAKSALVSRSIFGLRSKI